MELIGSDTVGRRRTDYGVGMQRPSVGGECRVHLQVQLEVLQSGGTEAAESVWRFRNGRASTV